MITFTLQVLLHPNSDQVPLPSESLGEVYVALFDYHRRTADDLSFEKGERLMVLEKEDEDWWLVKSLKSQKVGYILTNYIFEEKIYDARAEE